MIYVRTNMRVLFIWPTCAMGEDEEGLIFFEVAWLFWAVGVGETRWLT